MNRTTAMIASRLWQALATVGAFFAIGHALTPESFGLFALASSLALVPHAMVGAGFYEWVLTRRGDVADDDTAFWCAAIMGALAAVLKSAASPR